MKNRKVKSNRAQADYFELLVCQYICHLYKVTFSYSEDLAKLSNKILVLPDGKERLKLQNDNFIKIQPKIKEILDYEIGQKGKVVRVIWVGRNLLIETTSDVDAEHINKQKTRFSIKSIANTGTGTLNNLGARQIKKFLYVIIVNPVDEKIKKPVEKKLKIIKSIGAKKDKLTDVGYAIYVDGKPTYRVQTNYTNGIGIRAYCQRLFWI